LSLSLGTILDLPYRDYTGWDLKQTSQLVLLLSNGTSEGNEVLQQGALPFPQAAIAGYVEDYPTILQLRAYHKSKEAITFMDHDLAETKTVRVFECTAPQLWPGLWQYSIVLIDVSA
jgi:hypothetical protein